MGEASKQELMEVLEKALPEVLSDEQKSKKVSNLLQAMKKEGLVLAEGKNRYAKWSLKQFLGSGRVLLITYIFTLR